MTDLYRSLDRYHLAVDRALGVTHLVDCGAVTCSEAGCTDRAITTHDGSVFCGTHSWGHRFGGVA